MTLQEILEYRKAYLQDLQEKDDRAYMIVLLEELNRTLESLREPLVNVPAFKDDDADEPERSNPVEHLLQNSIAPTDVKPVVDGLNKVNDAITDVDSQLTLSNEEVNRNLRAMLYQLKEVRKAIKEIEVQPTVIQEELQSAGGSTRRRSRRRRPSVTPRETRRSTRRSSTGAGSSNLQGSSSNSQQLNTNLRSDSRTTNNSASSSLSSRVSNLVPRGIPPVLQQGLSSLTPTRATGVLAALTGVLGIADAVASSDSAPQAVGQIASTAVNTAGGIAGSAAGAEIGGIIGAFGGPAAPITVPAGALLGSMVGGYLGSTFTTDLATSIGDTVTGALSGEYGPAEIMGAIAQTVAPLNPMMALTQVIPELAQLTASSIVGSSDAPDSIPLELPPVLTAIFTTLGFNIRSLMGSNTTLSDSIETYGNSLVEGGQEMFDLIKSTGLILFNEMMDGLSDIGDSAVGGVSQAWESTKRGVGDAIGGVVGGISSAGGQAWKSIESTLKGDVGSPQLAMKVLMDRGYSKDDAAAIAAQYSAESGFNTKAVGDSGKARGIGQWHPDRVAKMEKLYNKKFDQITFEEQVGFTDWELKNTHGKALRAMQSATTPAEKAKALERYYEIDALSLKGGFQQKRVDDAEKYARIDDKVISSSQGLPQRVSEHAAQLSGVADYSETPPGELKGGYQIVPPEQLKIKSKESTAGGTAQKGTMDLAGLMQSRYGDSIKYFSAFNDQYHADHSPTSGHTKGLKFDMVLNDASQAEVMSNNIKAISQELGVPVNVLNEYADPSAKATGGHLDVGFKSQEHAQAFAQALAKKQEEASKAQPTVLAKGPRVTPDANQQPLGAITGELPTLPSGAENYWTINPETVTSVSNTTAPQLEVTPQAATAQVQPQTPVVTVDSSPITAQLPSTPTVSSAPPIIPVGTSQQGNSYYSASSAVYEENTSKYQTPQYPVGTVTPGTPNWNGSPQEFEAMKRAAWGESTPVPQGTPYSTPQYPVGTVTPGTPNWNGSPQEFEAMQRAAWGEPTPVPQGTPYSTPQYPVYPEPVQGVSPVQRLLGATSSLISQFVPGASKVTGVYNAVSPLLGLPQVPTDGPYGSVGYNGYPSVTPNYYGYGGNQYGYSPSSVQSVTTQYGGNQYGYGRQPATSNLSNYLTTDEYRTSNVTSANATLSSPVGYITNQSMYQQPATPAPTSYTVPTPGTPNWNGSPQEFEAMQRAAWGESTPVPQGTPQYAPGASLIETVDPTTGISTISVPQPYGTTQSSQGSQPQLPDVTSSVGGYQAAAQYLGSVTTNQQSDYSDIHNQVLNSSLVSGVGLLDSVTPSVPSPLNPNIGNAFEPVSLGLSNIGEPVATPMPVPSLPPMYDGSMEQQGEPSVVMGSQPSQSQGGSNVTMDEIPVRIDDFGIVLMQIMNI
jgi:hypothetical protein